MKTFLYFFVVLESDSDGYSHSLFLPTFMKCNISSLPQTFFKEIKYFHKMNSWYWLRL